jgi:hypothetical protein
LVGADRWPRFAAAAHERAMSVAGASTARILLAQATTLNTATDASPGGTVALSTPGAYVADTPRRWIGQPSAGSGECVDLVRQATGAPRSTEWRPSILVQGNMDIRPGTAIATLRSRRAVQWPRGDLPRAGRAWDQGNRSMERKPTRSHCWTARAERANDLLWRFRVARE